VFGCGGGQRGNEVGLGSGAKFVQIVGFPDGSRPIVRKDARIWCTTTGFWLPQEFDGEWEREKWILGEIERSVERVDVKREADGRLACLWRDRRGI